VSAPHPTPHAPPSAAAGGSYYNMCNTESTFETSRYNRCNIHLKTDETLEHAFKTLAKTLKTLEKHCKHTQYIRIKHFVIYV
jgi:hypothetical protein